MTKDTLIAAASTLLATATFVNPASAESCNRPAPVGVSTVVEIVSYDLVEGLSEAAYMEAVRATIPFLCAQPGFVRRLLSKGEDGRWIDYAEWEDLEKARQASERAMQDPALATFMSAAKPETMDFRYLTVQHRIE